MLATVKKRVLAVATAMSAVILMSLPAVAVPVQLFVADDFYIPRPAANSDQVGVERLLISFDVAANGFADLIGQTCLFTVGAANGSSVHLNNYGILNTGAATNNLTNILETESLPDVITTTLTDQFLTIGPVITLSNVMLPDPDDRVGTSVDYVVTVDCDISDETTTTTIVDDTTTTIVDDTTTTVADDTTTTIVDETTTTSAGDITTTTGFITTTTVPGDSSSTSVVGSTTSIPPVSGSTLPFTGPPVEAAGIAMAATALLMLGGGVLLAAKRG
ncbi:MAG: hypothetical protein ACFCVC_06730 [Acidimicrobiia bacterium]